MSAVLVSEADKLERMAEELIEMARVMRGGAAERPTEPRAPLPKSRALNEAARYSPKLARLAAIAKAQYETRRHRNDVMPAKLLGEASWDIVLDLFINQVAGRKVSISSACIAANVPSTTALRYVYVLEGHGLIKRTDDRSDHRRSFLELSEECFVRMCRYLDKRESTLAAATNATIAELGLIMRNAHPEI